MSGLESLTNIQDALEKIFAASKNQPGNQEEILKLIKQIPLLSKSILPIPQNVYAVSPSHSDILDLFQSISKHLISKLKHIIHDDGTEMDRPKSICVCLENLSLLAGHDFTKEKMSEIVSHATDLLIQENMEFMEDIVGNLPQVASNMLSLIFHIKTFTLDMSKALFLCDSLSMTPSEQESFITETILEKLSTELLTVVDALKQHSIMSSSNKVANQLESSSCMDSVSTSNLFSLGSILNGFIDLEQCLNDGIPSKAKKSKYGPDRMMKSLLKLRLSNILRSSQEGGWSRSATIYGNWDWQDILREIAAALRNSITEAFENFHTKELSVLKNNQQDDAYRIESLPSLSSEWLSKAPKKTISQFKEVLVLIKSLLPYAVVGSHYKPLSSLLSCYIDESSQCLKVMHSYLSMIMNDFPEKVTASTLFHIIATSEDVIECLQFCSVSINSEVRAPFQGICHSYNDTSETLRSMVVQYLQARIRNCILHDGESNHYTDPKEFADGERCSYAIENWDRFLDRIWRDSDSTLSDDNRDQIFKEIFLDSLNVLKSRYLRCRPSYNRTKQLSLDIPHIIRTCQQYFSLNDSSLFSENDCDNILHTCKVLNAVRSLLTTPINILQESLTNLRRYPEKSKANDRKMPLRVFLLKSVKGQSSLEQCLCALMCHEKSLLRFIASESFKAKLSSDEAKEFDRCLYAFVTSGVSLWSDEFFNCALASVRNDCRALLESCVFPPGSRLLYSWQSVFFHKLDEVLCKSLATPMQFLCHPCWSTFTRDVISTLPPNIKASVSDMTANDGTANDRLSASLILVFLGLKQALCALPEWMIKFMSKIETTLQHQSDTPAIHSAVNVIVNETQRLFHDPDKWEEHCQVDLTKDGLHAMQMAGSLLSRVCRKDFTSVSDGGKIAIECLHSFAKQVQECFRLFPEVETQSSDEELLQECRFEIANLRDRDDVSYESLIKIKEVLCVHSGLLKSTFGGGPESAADPLNAMLDSETCDDALGQLDKKTVAHIVSHRWEARKGAALTDEQADDLGEIQTLLRGYL